jgi:hypothetical protein
MHFSDLKWISYEFSKVWIFSGISIWQRKPFTPDLNLALHTDWWASGQVISHVGKTSQQCWLGVDWARMGAGDRRRWQLRPPQDVRISALETEDDHEQLEVAPPGKGHRSIAGNGNLQRCTPAIKQTQSTRGPRRRYWASEMRRLTVKLMRCSMVLIDDGGERTFADSGEWLQKKSAQFAPLQASPDALLL